MHTGIVLLLALLQPADRIWFNGSVVTMDGRARVAQAVAVQAGKVLQVGADTEIRKLAGPGTKLSDLHGKALLPGFYAAHDHLPQAGVVALYQVDLNSPPIGRMNSIADILAALKEKAARAPAGQWIVGRGYDDTLLVEKRHPNRTDLDTVTKEHPIWIIHTSGHLGAANSRALAIARIDRNTPDPKGGVIQRDGSGEPTGVFEENLGLVTRHIPGQSREERLKAIEWCDRHYAAKGVTTTVIAGNTAERLEDLREAARRGLLRLRVRAMIGGGAALKTIEESIARYDIPEKIHTGAVKLLHDGSIQGYTGYLAAPYHKQPEGKQDFRGYPSRSREELAAMVKKFHRAGYQVCVHGNGDAAIDDILDAYAEALKELPRQDARHRIEHCQTPRPDQLDRMRDLGVTPSYFNGHVYYWGDRHRDIFLGPERAARISPLKSSLARGIRFTLHNDTPVTPVDPLLLVWAAVNRVTRNGSVLGPGERITALEALRAVTSDAAWQNFEEATKGSIAPGKLADFVVLDQNPLAAAPVRLKDLKVLETIVGGRTLFEQPGRPVD